MSTTTKITAATIQPENKKYSVIIPAAGMGSRMKSYGPKILLQIPNTETTILDNQLRHIHKYLPQAEIIIVGGFEIHKIKKHLGEDNKKRGRRNIKIVENVKYETTNVVRSIGIGLEEAKYNDVIIIYGDLVFNAYAMKVPFGSISSIVIDGYGKMGKGEIGCIINGNMLERMMYDLPDKWAQIVYLTDMELKLLRQICKNRKFDVYFGFEAINIILNSGGAFTTYSPRRMKITDIDSSKELENSWKIIT